MIHIYSNSKEVCKFEMQPNDLDFNQTFEVLNLNYSLSNRTDGSSLILTLKQESSSTTDTESPKDKKTSLPSNIISKKLEIYIDGLNFSIICKDSQNIRKEIFLVNIERL